MVEVTSISVSSVQRILRAFVSAPHRFRPFETTQPANHVVLIESLICPIFSVPVKWKAPNMLYRRASIQRAIASQKIGITPFEPSMLGESSYTFRIGKRFWRPSDDVDEIDLENPKPWSVEHPVSAAGMHIEPGQFLIIESLEFLTLPDSVCCILSARGYCAQAGLSVLLGSHFAEPRTTQRLLFEMRNVSDKRIRFRVGLPIVKGLFLDIDDPSNFNQMAKMKVVENDDRAFGNI